MFTSPCISVLAHEQRKVVPIHCTLDLDYEQRRGLDQIWEFKILESSFKKNLRGTPLAIRDSGV